MLRVVHMMSSAESGGAETVLLEILASMRRAHPEWALEVIVPRRGALLDRLSDLGVKAVVLPFPARFAAIGEAGASSRFSVVLRLLATSPWLLRYAVVLRRLLRARSGAEVIVLHAHGFKAQVLAALAAPADVRVIWHVHDYVGTRAISRWFLARLASRCSAIIANSRSVATDVREVCSGAKVVAMYNAVDLERFAPAGPVLDLDRLAKIPAAPGGTVRVGMVGMFGRWKGHATFLAALARLDDLPLRGYVIGGAAYDTADSQLSEQDLRETAGRLGLSDRVVFTGPVGDIPSVMRALDVVVHASTLPEPFGMVIAEAMACGRAVVVSSAGGAAELVQPDVDALTHPPGDEEALALAIRRLVEDEALRSRLGGAARVTAEHRFDGARLARELEPLYLVA